MTYLLDTDTLIDCIVGIADTRDQVFGFIERGDEVAVCAITVTELYSGMNDQRRAKWEPWLRALPYWHPSASAISRSSTRRPIDLSLSEANAADMATTFGRYLQDWTALGPRLTCPPIRDEERAAQAASVRPGTPRPEQRLLRQGLGASMVPGPLPQPGQGQQRVGQLVRDVDLPIRAGRIHEDQVDVQVQQMRHRAEHLGGDLIQRLQQEVHRPLRGIVAEPGQVLDEHPLRDPLRAGQLAARFQGALGDQREDDPLGDRGIQLAAGRHPVLQLRISEFAVTEQGCRSCDPG